MSTATSRCRYLRKRITALTPKAQGQLDEELRRIEQALECVRFGGAASDEGLAGLEADLSALDGRVGEAESGISSLEGRVTSNEGAITSLDGRINANDGDISSLDGRVGTNEGAISTLDGRVGTNEGALSALGGTVRSGAGAPGSGIGDTGDYYHNTATDDLYGPKGASTWPGTPLDLGGGDSLPSYQSVWSPVSEWVTDPGPPSGQTDFDEFVRPATPLRTGGGTAFYITPIIVFNDNENGVAGVTFPCPQRYTGDPIKLRLLWTPEDGTVTSVGDTCVFNFRAALIQPNKGCNLASLTMGTAVGATEPIVDDVESLQAMTVNITPDNQGISFAQNEGSLFYVFLNLFGTSSNHEVGNVIVYGMWAQFPLDTDTISEW